MRELLVSILEAANLKIKGASVGTQEQREVGFCQSCDKYRYADCNFLVTAYSVVNNYFIQNFPWQQGSSRKSC